jgi:hypothetical protein
MRELRRAMHMPIGLAALNWMVRAGVPLLLSIGPELAVYGRYPNPTRFREEGFEFHYPVLSAALA